MNIDNNLIYLLALSIFAVFFGGRIISILIKAFWENTIGRGNQKTRDLDEMIKEQERILRSRMKYGKVSTPTQTKSTGKKYFSETEELYLKAKDKNQLIEGLDQVLSLFDNAKWGQGDLYKSFLQNAKLKSGCEQDILLLSQVITKFLRDNYFIQTNKELPGFKQIEKAILSKLILTKLFQETISAQGPIIHFLKNKSKSSEKDIIIATHYLFLTFNGEATSNLLERVLKIGGDPSFLKKYSDLQISELIDKKLPLPDGQGYLGVDFFLKEVVKQAELIKGLSPLPEVKNIKDAYKVLGINENAKKEEVKQAYKAIVKTRHPDVMAAKGLSSEIEKKLSANFAIIQKAYEMIKSQK
ncbi:MAG: DnaJ domain-containing protein [Bacteriovoracaceae bacterium]